MVIAAETFLLIYSLFTIFSTIGLFCTGFEICWRIKVNGKTDGISSAPFHLGLISAVFWLQYGILRGDKVIIGVNIVAALLYSFYISFYIMKCTRKYRPFSLILVEVIAILSIHFYVVQTADDIELVSNKLGIACMILNMANVGAPLLSLTDVCITRSTANLPFPLCCANLLVCTEWLIYGMLMKDFYLKVANFINVLISIAQLIPFAVYPRKQQNILYRDDVALL